MENKECQVINLVAWCTKNHSKLSKIVEQHAYNIYLDHSVEILDMNEKSLTNLLENAKNKLLGK